MNIATFEDTENSMTPGRRSFLLRRAQASERIAKRARWTALTIQRGSRIIRNWNDPAHVIELGDLKDDLRGLLNPDGSIHIWPYSKEEHCARAYRFNLYDSQGATGLHFYLRIGPNASAYGGWWDDELPEVRDAVVNVLHRLGVFEKASSVEPCILGFDDDPWKTPEPDEHLIEEKECWIVVTDDRGIIASAGGLGREFDYHTAWMEADNLNARAREMGLATRYVVKFDGFRRSGCASTIWATNR